MSNGLELQKLSNKSNLDWSRGELEARNAFQRQPFTKYLRQTIVFLWNSAIREKLVPVFQEILTTVMDIIFWELLILYRFLFSPQMKRSVNIRNIHSIYELPQELLNNLRLRILVPSLPPKRKLLLVLVKSAEKKKLKLSLFYIKTRVFLKYFAHGCSANNVFISRERLTTEK